MRLVTFGKLHGNTEIDQLELSGMELYILCRTQIDPVRFSVDVGQLVDLIRMINNFYGLLSHFSLLPDIQEMET